MAVQPSVYIGFLAMVTMQTFTENSLPLVLNTSTTFDHTHTFSENGIYDEVLLEITRTYVDNRPPRRFYFTQPVAEDVRINCSSSCTFQAIPAPSGLLEIKSNRSFSAWW